MVKKSSPQPTKKSNPKYEAAATRMTIYVSAIAAISLVVLALIAMTTY